MPLRLSRTPCEVSRVSSRYSNVFVASRSFWSRTTPAAAPVPTRPEIYDVVCVGGGPAGLSLLSALRASPKTANLKIALVEGQDLNKPQVQAESTTFSNRCSSLTPGSVKFLNEIGAWKHISASRVQPYQAMQVWDGVSGSSISFDPS
ncbi:hypothetical protein KCU73_g1386, partial [Aureobasidium melanogenum]